MTKGSDLLVAALENEGVERIFGLPGEENLDVVESLRKSKIELVLTRHEQAAAFMAATQGRLTGRPGVCLSTLGPGALNFTTGAAYAYLGAMPMLMITGQKAIKSARSLPDERVELAADITFDNFLKARVEVLPQSALSRLSDAIRQEIIPTKVTPEQDGTLSQISMEAKISKDNHNAERRYDYKFTGKATVQDFPKTPDPADVTPLPDKPAVDDFYRRLGDLQGS